MSAKLPEPTTPFQVKAKAAYPARSDIEISLEKDAIYTVLKTDGKGLWWQAKDPAVGNVGWFPASFVDVVVVEASPPVSLPPTPAPLPVQPVVQAQVSTPNLPARPSSSGAPQLPSRGNTLPVVQPVQPIVQPVAQPVQPQPVPAQPQQTQPQSTLSTSTSLKASQSQKRPTEEPPRPRNEIRERGIETSKVTLKLQLIDVDFNETKKVAPTAFICRRTIYDDAKVEVLKTTTIKKGSSQNFNYNELFHIVVNDAEEEIVLVRFCTGNKMKNTGKEFLGEIQFPLRGSIRDFDAPDYSLKKFPILAKDGKSLGEAKIFIQFHDTRIYKGPHNFEHRSHLGFDKTTGKFDANNIPAEWKKMFASVGIKPSHLQSPDFRENIFNIMATAEAQALNPETTSSTGGLPPVPDKTTKKAPPPTPNKAGPGLPPKAGGSLPVSGGPTPPPLPVTGGPAAPPPPPIGGGPKIGGGPPPPGGGPPVLGGPKPPPGGPPPPGGGGAPGGGPKLPAPASSSSGSGGGAMSASQLQAAMGALASASSRQVPAASPIASPATLESSLRDAMSSFRPAIAGDDDGADEWSNDEEWT